ncbi:DNA sulfur modification protein DndD [Rhizorhabdus dicambivorans]|uniref:DNA sulfur modification protein DndD n=1 Tax=Rhizorhabdus dicambivorans TaxID=1850238 RepID=A0A2A4FTG2_9SPHN|nr:DNA sulfur modification protein DndD [Rhizorhabdus dicambivorans]ATE65676.1 DNA sulfur modification protein DndD [Rhizorhabdus dicambivorans]PCE41020.1 DNA sulfur modification protein DndD [Rhizorhabdus dicambivorans]
MILRNVTLQDFGVYAGTTTLDLIPRRKDGHTAPVILIGGKNGVGKTTLLEAVRLALYGRRALGARVAQADYDAFLRDRVNRASGSEGAAVSLEFDYAEAGTIHRYRIRREWATRGRSVVETLDLLKDGEMITSVPREEWHSFLQELIPPGVSQLFFFDGEKISEIAEGRDDDEQLGTAIRSLLGIDLVGRLRVDLGLYIARHQKDDDSATATWLEAVNRDIQVAERRAAVLGDDVAELVSQRDSQARAAEQVRRQFVAEGGDAAVQRDKIEAERGEVRRAMGHAEHELRDTANKLLPFAMAPKLTAAFRDALAGAGAGYDAGATALLLDAIVEWRAEGVPARDAKWSTAHWADLEGFLRARTRAPDATADCPAIREVGDGTTAIARLDEVESIVRPRVADLLSEMDRLSVRDGALQAALGRADSASAGLLLDELQLTERRLGATEAVLAARQEEWKLIKGQLVTLEREQKRLLSEQAGSEKAQMRSALAARAAQALADYEERLLTHKLGQLKSEFVRCFNHLARKENLVADVEIDPTSFAITLIDRAGNSMPKASLSAGEKQIYAIAMLWALARTSGRPLPMIIDTPLARLDSEHRAKLVERYFPRASHQVILLSTDTEIDEGLLAKLKPSISHSYRLDFDQVDGRTDVTPGYFGTDSHAAEGRRALQQA